MVENLQAYISGLPGTAETFPFGPQPCVYKVGGKIFALLSTDRELPQLSLKCDPEEAQTLRGMHDAILPGYHLNKEHWNTIILDESLPEALILQMTDESYRLVLLKPPERRGPHKGINK